MRVSALRQRGRPVKRVAAYLALFYEHLSVAVAAMSVGVTLGVAVCASFPGVPCHP
jgi:hypothetical protein